MADGDGFRTHKNNRGRYTHICGIRGEPLTTGEVVDFLNLYFAGAKKDRAELVKLARELANYKTSYKASRDMLVQMEIRTGYLLNALRGIAAQIPPADAVLGPPHTEKEAIWKTVAGNCIRAAKRALTLFGEIT